MVEINADKVQSLRAKTGAGIMECKQALREAAGDEEKAITILKTHGLKVAAQKSARQTKEGVIGSYIHPGDRIGVLVEVNCETDFVARNADFRNLVKELTLQVAASAPDWVRREDVPADVLEKEKAILREQALREGKQAAVLEKIIQGRLEKFFEQHCLIDQPYIRDPQGKQKVRDILSQTISQLRENITIRRFVRFQVGE